MNIKVLIKVGQEEDESMRTKSNSKNKQSNTNEPTRLIRQGFSHGFTLNPQGPADRNEKEDGQARWTRGQIGPAR